MKLPRSGSAICKDLLLVGWFLWVTANYSQQFFPYFGLGWSTARRILFGL